MEEAQEIMNKQKGEGEKKRRWSVRRQEPFVLGSEAFLSFEKGLLLPRS